MTGLTELTVWGETVKKVKTVRKKMNVSFASFASQKLSKIAQN